MRSKNIEDLKNLIREGYKICSKTTQLGQNGKVEIELVKGNEKRTMSVENDNEFTEFCLHFKQFDDGYGNQVFVYVEDPGAYKQPIHPPKEDYEIYVGSIKIKDPSLYHLIESGPKQPLSEANFIVNIMKNDQFKNFDFRDDILIKEQKSDNVVFRGHVQKILNGDNIIAFLCQGGPRQLQTKRIGFKNISLSQIEALNFMAESANNKISFHCDCQPNTNKRYFSIICFLYNLGIPNSFSIGDITFYSFDQGDDDKNIEKGKIFDSQTKYIKAKTDVEASSFYKAILIGYEKISRVVDLIRLRVNMSIPYYSKDKPSPIPFNFQRQNSHFELSSVVYCREKITNSALIYDTNVLSGHPLIFQYDPEEFFVGFYENFKELLSKSSEEMSNRERSIALSIHWIGLAIRSNNKFEQIISLFNALEFIVKDSKLDKIFNKKEIKKIVDKIAEIEIEDHKKTIIEGKIKKLNDHSLREKLDDLIKTNDIDLNEKEKEIYQNMRDIRNDLQHGDYIDINNIKNDDIEKFISIVEKILLYSR